jgi:hypothetical protein
MNELIRRSVAIMFAGVVGFAGAASAQPAPSGDPPGRVGRLAFVQGTVSFHDRDQTDWAPAVTNTPLTSGDALWTEPNARSEVSIAGTRVRLDSGTQLDMLVIDDSQTRMQLDQGRLDIKTFTYDTHQPYEVLTPRGTITLQQQGDYYVEAGSTQDPTRLGVRAGAAQIQASNGQVLAVRAGEVGEIYDDNGSPQLRTIPSAPPPMPAYWAERDRIVVYDQPTQYVTANMTGYEDLNGYGSWSNDPEYGQVWAPRAVVAGWEPYRTGQWSYVQPWGWTWVDEQPWGFAPYHYGRWANRNNRWVWVPPQRDLRPVYAPALVAFVGGVELGVAIGQQNRAPVGWFPLGPREAYVPPYSNDRDYYRRLNASARVQDQVMEQNWQRAQRREAVPANQQQTQQTAFMNRRFATVVPADDFAHSRPVARVALKVAPEKLTAAPVAPVAAPPAPTQSIRAVQAPSTGTAPGTAPAPRPSDPNARPPQGQAQGQATVTVPTTETRLSNMQAIGRPTPTTADRPKAPGPQIATAQPNAPNAAPNATTPNAAPNAAHPGLPPLAPRTGAAPPQLQGERTPAPGQPAQPGTPPKPADNRAVTTPPPTGAQPPAGQPGQPPRPPGQANLPPVHEPNANRPVEPPKPGEPPKPQQAQQPVAPAQPAPQPPHQAEPPKPQGATTPPPHPAEPPKPQQAQQPAAPAQPAPQPQHQAEPPKPQGAVTPPPPPQRQAAPAPQPQAPPPPAQVHAPTPPPQTAPPAQAHAPAPPPQPQAHAPAPPPAPAAHPAPAPAPQAPQQAHAPAPQPAPAPKKEEEKK